jgi:hypothetical protein
MARFLRLLLASTAAALALSGTAQAAGGNYVFAGGTAKQQAQVVAALNASTFNWSVVPDQITIHIVPNVESSATVGHIWLDPRVLDTGKFAWGMVQHEYAHEVDFFLLGEFRDELHSALGGKVWCMDEADESFGHGDYGCERFASTLAWAYWPNKANCMKPENARDESAAMAPAAFKKLMNTVLAGRDTAVLAARR